MYTCETASRLRHYVPFLPALCWCTTAILLIVFHNTCMLGRSQWVARILQPPLACGSGNGESGDHLGSSLENWLVKILN